MKYETKLDKQTANFLREDTLIKVREYFEAIQVININPIFKPLGTSGYFEIKAVGRIYLLVKKANFKLLKSEESLKFIEDILADLDVDIRNYILKYLKIKQHKTDYHRETKSTFFGLNLHNEVELNGVKFYIFT